MRRGRLGSARLPLQWSRARGRTRARAVMPDSGFAARHWFRRSAVSAALLPFSWCYGLLFSLRRWLYRIGFLGCSRLPVPVVVVGNVVVGGTGKTPLVLKLAEELSTRGHRPGIVSRGWPGTVRGPAEVTADADPAAVGDEALLMSARGVAPVWIGRDRAETGRALLAAHPGVDVLIFDDGLQYHGLMRDVEVEVIDARGYGNGFLLPAGPLRERIPRAADFKVINLGQEQGQTAGFGAISEKWWPMRLVPAGWFRAGGDGGRVDEQILRDAAKRSGALHAIAGIGNPQRFFDTLRSLGLDPREHPFPDHHLYVASELQLADAEWVLMTEKDAVKCTRFNDSRFLYLRVEAALDAAFLDSLCAKIWLH